ncbi:endonuclease Q family protein [Aciduricibacillus chroicocephali]|uniref:Endonuclease Q family protein n=1 Tax=Aciduricibacillus chroicocephali TaxID=3054939 RepID=A0ABY9KSJ9_9BACI|nr:endonuclease Q family protein [Bacillaceae bacterium 44XB]
MLKNYFADLHIHIGRDMYGKPVKITGAKSLTLTNVLKEASRRKGIELIGVIDCHAPAVQEEIKQLMESGEAQELADGGIRFENVTLIPGAEIEVYDEYAKGPIHVLCFFPSLERIGQFSEWLVGKMKNITLSSQRYYGTGKELQYKTKELSGLFLIAHAFTPFKSLYGKGVAQSLEEVFDPDLVDGVELGLSSDTTMADAIEELQSYTFVTNSDAHSLAKIGREYQSILMKEPSFKELELALHEVEGRHVSENYGMNPLLGKYYRTVCADCFTEAPPGTAVCPSCGSKKIVKGVRDRIEELATEHPRVRKRPPYKHQVPLEYLPKLGPKTFEKLLSRFGTEMEVIHRASLEGLKETVPDPLAEAIIRNRRGEADVQAGGGGKYGKINP